MKQSYSRTIYLSGEENKKLLERCDKILEREQWSFNRLIQEALKEYEVRHGLGNNSFQLDTFGITWTKALSVNKCGFKNCRKFAVGVGVYNPKNQTFGLCNEHFKIAKNNSKIWSNLKLPGADAQK